jgi:hypothetical protein
MTERESDFGVEGLHELRQDTTRYKRSKHQDANGRCWEDEEDEEEDEEEEDAREVPRGENLEGEELAV